MRYLPLVWRYATTQVQDKHLAEDIVSESMLALLKNIHQLDAEAPHVAGWLRSVVRNKVADHHRAAFRIKDRLEKIGQNGSPDRNGECPSKSMERCETRAQVLSVLEQLSDKHRLLLEWKYAEGLRVREMADRLGETEKGIEASLYRARREFRRIFEIGEQSIVMSGAKILSHDQLPQTQ